MRSVTSDQTVVAVLAGGQGNRLGGKKPSALLAGQPLVSYPVNAARAAGLEVLIVAKPSTALPDLQTSVLLEPDELHHPLCGLITALEHAPRVLAVGCDMPLLTAPLLSWLAAQPDVPVMLQVDGRAEPFPSLHGRSELPALRAALSAQASLREAFLALSPTLLAEADLTRFGEPAELICSVNTPAQLAAAEFRMRA